MGSDKDLFDRLEDAENQPFDTAEQPLSDDELRRRGLQPVKAYVRTKASRAAERAQRHREAAATQGWQQINVMAPVEAKSQLRGLAEAMREGRVTSDDIDQFVAGAPPRWRSRYATFMAGLIVGLVVGSLAAAMLF